MKTIEKYTLITGASMGLGREFAKVCARKGMNLILVSLPGENLPELSSFLINRYKINCFYYELDLTRKKPLISLCSRICDQFSINMIINNAGFGGGSRFESSSPEFLDRMIQLNIRAVTFLIRLMIPELKRHDKAWIMNISSMAAFIPMPFKTIYPASKAFVYSFSRALSEELKNTGISVSVVNPGPIMTNVDVIRRFKSYGILSRMCLISAEQVASQSIRSMLSGKKVIIPGMLNKINRFLIKLIPDSLSLYLVSNLSRRELTSPGKINLRK